MNAHTEMKSDGLLLFLAREGSIGGYLVLPANLGLQREARNVLHHVLGDMAEEETGNGGILHILLVPQPQHSNSSDRDSNHRDEEDKKTEDVGHNNLLPQTALRVPIGRSLRLVSGRVNHCKTWL